VLRLRGRGFHKKQGGRGDQMVTLMVDLPVGDDALVEFVRAGRIATRATRAAIWGV